MASASWIPEFFGREDYSITIDRSSLCEQFGPCRWCKYVVVGPHDIEQRIVGMPDELSGSVRERNILL